MGANRPPLQRGVAYRLGSSIIKAASTKKTKEAHDDEDESRTMTLLSRMQRKMTTLLSRTRAPDDDDAPAQY
jgi:hypothetical protein